MSQAVFGVIVGNRDFFPDRLVTEGREDILALLAKRDIEAIVLTEKDTRLGGVETWQDAKVCAELFRRHADRVDGILVILPNFGDEKGVAETIKLSGLNVPILVQAYPDDLESFTVERRRDAWCGKISVCNNLRQYGYPYALTADHTVRVDTEAFEADLDRFLGVCRVVGGLRNARLGAIGARPNAFNTVRYSEKLLQACGIGVSTIDLAEILGAAERLRDDDAKVRDRIEAIRAYIKTEGMSDTVLAKMARLGIVIDDWMASNDLDATAVQCWTAIQQNYGINACTLMSMTHLVRPEFSGVPSVSGKRSGHSHTPSCAPTPSPTSWRNDQAMRLSERYKRIR
jgi:L-fucose isomerase-like protein